MLKNVVEINGESIFTIQNEVVSKTVVLMTHGYAEHILRYEWFMHQLSQQGIKVIGFDQRGHGQSSGKRAMVNSFEEYVEDMHHLVKEHFVEGNRNFLFGHSMGGLVCLRYLQRHGGENIHGIVTTGAAMKPAEVSPILIFLAPIIAGIFPWLPTVKLDKTSISRDPEVVKSYDNRYK